MYLGVTPGSGRSALLGPENYSIFEEDYDNDKVLCSHFAVAFSHYRTRDFHAAAELFSQLLEEFPEDIPTLRLQTKCSHLAQVGVEEGWTGVVRLRDK